LQGTVVHSKLVAGLRVGERKDIPDEAIALGTEYGLDWAIILPWPEDIVKHFQSSMRDHGVWTYEDFNTMPDQAFAATVSISKRLFALAAALARQALGDNV
jgi:hypothetical protein